MKKIILLSLIIFTFSMQAFADKGISIKVPLSPAGSFKIESKKVKGKLKKSGDTYKAKKIYVKVKDLNSGMDLRDDHMKNADRLDQKKHPKITVENIVAKGGKGTGVITIKGIKKKISFKYTASSNHIVAKFKLKPTDFKLKKLSYLGVGVKEVIYVTATVPVAK